MNDWMNDFIARCLADVPLGKYRTRTEKELQDHLLSLSQELEEAGYPPEEAQTLAQSRMGDPAELSRRCLREWKRRSCLRWPFTFSLLLYGLCIAAAGLLYLANARNFGKSVVGLWAIVAIPGAKLMIHSFYGFFTRIWTPVRWSCLLLAVIQLPPILCWMAFGDVGFEMSGVMIPGWLGFAVHLLFLLWGLANYYWISEIQQESWGSGQTA